MPTITARQLRDLVSDEVRASIELHRLSRNEDDPDHAPAADPAPTEEEIDDFLVCNPLLDGETVSYLTDPGLLGYLGSAESVSDGWLAEFRKNVRSWAGTQEWLAGDLVPYHTLVAVDAPEPQREVWTPETKILPSQAFLAQSPSHLLLAEKLLREGRLLSEMHWRDFEKLIAELLKSHGWSITLMSGSKDGGIDVLAERNDSLLGALRSIWQAKKYATDHKVQLRHLRELSAVVDRDRATKGVIVTTSSLTRGAIDWIQRDTYRLEAKDGRYIERWVKRRLNEA